MKNSIFTLIIKALLKFILYICTIIHNFIELNDSQNTKDKKNA